MLKITVPIHSFVDLITNSSSEVFVNSTTATVTAIREVIQHMMTVAGHKASVEDWFDINLCITEYDSWDAVNGKYIETIYKQGTPEFDRYRYSKPEWVSIELKDLSNNEAIKIQSLIQNMCNSFETKDCSC